MVAVYFKAPSQIFFWRADENYENLCQDSRDQGRNLNPSTPEYEARLLIA